MVTKILKVASLGAIFALTSCGGLQPETKSIDADPLAATLIADFAQGRNSEIFGSDGWTNGGNFNCVWSSNNITYSDGEMHLAIKEEKKSAWLDGKSVEYEHTGGEARSYHHYSYGDYEVRMKPTDVVGSVSSFFVCTGNYDLVNGKENPWDEVDIEFLGKDTTHVQFNYFVNGVGGHEYMYNLGFDASKEFHDYGFRWEKDQITWFVDSKPVYQVKASSLYPLPSTPGRVLTNYWPCSSEGWAGKYTGNQGKTTDYKWIKCSGAKSLIDGETEPTTPTSDSSGETSTSQEEGGIDWKNIDSSDLTFTTDCENYAISKNNGVTKVVYTDVGGQSYRTIEANVAEEAKGHNAVYMKLKNAGNAKNRIRVNMMDPKDKGKQNESCNVSATMNGNAIYTDTTWGGSFFEFEPDTTVEAIVYFDGDITGMQFMIDSSCLDADPRSGVLEISDIKFGGVREETSEEEVSSEESVTSEEVSSEEADSLALSFDSTELYTVSPNGTASKSIDVTYTEVGGQTYKNIGTDIANYANGKNVFVLDIENKGEAPVRFRADIQGTAVVGNTNAINVSAYAEGHGEVYTDTTWGGSFITVQPAEKVTFSIGYDEATDRGTANHMLFFIDSSTDNGDTHAGHIVLSNFNFELVA